VVAGRQPAGHVLRRCHGAHLGRRLASLAASGSVDGTIKIWDLRSSKLVLTLEGHADNVRSVSFLADGRLLASKGRDGAVRLWDCATWTPAGEIAEPGQSAWLPRIAFHPSQPCWPRPGLTRGRTTMPSSTSGSSTRIASSARPGRRPGTAETALPPLLHGRVYGDFRQPDRYFVNAFNLILSVHDIPPNDPARAELRRELEDPPR
jgi:WD domain, G-beta repeat